MFLNLCGRLRSPVGLWAVSPSNPFTPDFGQLPPVLAGRDQTMDKMGRALAAGPSRKEFTTLLLGPRGIGKTTVLTAIADEARAGGWRIIRIDAPLSPAPEQGAVAAIAEKVHDHLDDIEAPPRKRLTGASIPVLGVGASWENTAARRPTCQKLLDTLVAASVQSGGAGVLLAVDEFHNLTPPEASVIAAALQEITKVGQKNLAFVGIGLPHIEHTLLTNEGFTFFHRCNRERIENITIHEAMDAVGRPLADNGFTISGPRLRRAASATRGLGYAVQSIGYHLWELAGPPPAEVTDAHLDQAISLMDGDVSVHVTIPIWSRLSPTDKLFLFAMLPDDGPSRLKDIGGRLGSRASNTSAYKRRLLDQGAITETGRGLVSFASDAIRYRAIEEQDLERAIQEYGRKPDRAANHPTSPATTADLLACGHWMPRVEANCILKAGHRGSHRRAT